MNHHTKLGLTIFVTVTMFLIALAFELIWCRGRRWLALFVCSIMLLVMVLTIHFAVAHDHNRPGLDKWYGTLASGKGPCCGGPSVDAKTLDGADWETKDGHYRVKIDGVWWDVPDDAVLTQPNLDGRALVWPIGGWGGLTIRCFMPGSMT